MSNEIRSAFDSGSNLYANIMNSIGQRWNGSIFETYTTANYSTYTITLTEQGTSGVYVANFPTDIETDGTYDYFVYNRSGASPSEGDTVVGTGQVTWKYSAAVPASADESSPLRAIALSGYTVYAHIMNTDGERWNGSDFETYTAANYANYDVSMTEQGSSGVYVGTFPTAIDPGSYEYFAYRQMGGSPATGDPVIGTGVISWNGTTIVQTDVTGMSGATFRDYVVQKFKRTDKDVDIYEATTDTINDMRNRFDFADDQLEMATTDQITAIGQFQLNLESNFGLLVSDILVIDDDSTDPPLLKLSKTQFDELYPNPRDSNVSTGKPQHYCIYQNKIWLGPVPDSTSYIYRISFSDQPGDTIDASTASVPFTRLYRECVRYGVLFRLYQGLDEEMSNYFLGFYESTLAKAMGRENRNRDSIRMTSYQGI